MTTEGYRRRVVFRPSPQFSISCRLSMAVSPEAAKSAVLASSYGLVLSPQSYPLMRSLRRTVLLVPVLIGTSRLFFRLSRKRFETVRHRGE